MSVKRVTSKKPYLLTQDDDCHWYLIPYDSVDRFEAWIKWNDDDSEDRNDHEPTADGLDFNSFRINGPHTLKIYSWADTS